jgi:hypothetical protein
MDGGLSLFSEILITTSPAKFGRIFGKNVIKFYVTGNFGLLYVMIV